MCEIRFPLFSGWRTCVFAVGTLLLILFLHAPVSASDDVQWGLGKDSHALDKTHENLNWGFRGIPWGREKEKVGEEYELVQCSLVEPEVESCLALNATQEVGDIPLQYVRLVFTSEKFSGVSLRYDKEHYEKMLEKLVVLLGDPSGERETFPYWELPMISAWASNTHFSVRKKLEASDIDDEDEKKPITDSPTF